MALFLIWEHVSQRWLIKIWINTFGVDVRERDWSFGLDLNRE
tara:strand:+ start:507 stop:632 length:126 start_codon:yes stop_codon:yes gene_type:complete